LRWYLKKLTPSFRQTFVKVKLVVVFHGKGLFTFQWFTYVNILLLIICLWGIKRTKSFCCNWWSYLLIISNSTSFEIRRQSECTSWLFCLLYRLWIFIVSNAYRTSMAYSMCAGISIRFELELFSIWTITTVNSLANGTVWTSLKSSQMRSATRTN
jgi:hypothetical protein